MYEEISTQCSINRVYISCCFNPNVSENSVLDCIEWSNKIGKYVILCDTDSFANSDSVFSICSKAKSITPNIGVHFHISQNIEECIQSAYDAGVRIFDTSIGGLGGCFSVQSAEGNIPTESLVFWATLKDITIEQKIDLYKLMAVSKYAISLEESELSRLLNWTLQKMNILI